MEGKDWKFSRFIPDADDVDAQLNAMQSYSKYAESILGIDWNEDTMHVFTAAFNRGCAWMQAKLQEANDGETEVR